MVFKTFLLGDAKTVWNCSTQQTESIFPKPECDYAIPVLQ